MRRRPAFLLIALSLAAGVAAAQPLSERSARVVDYRIEARLVPEERLVVGRETVTWRNRTGRSTGELRFHLYWNAAREGSTFLREAATSFRSRSPEPGRFAPGSMEILEVRTADGVDLLPTLEYRHPDDDNEADRTVASVQLPAPVAPGGEVTVEVAWEGTVPIGFPRTGTIGGFWFIAQWYPKLGAFEDGVWNCHQYHARSEFYADFGTYRVAITVPGRYRVGATGRRVEEREGDDRTRTVVHAQADVHDFAWLADDDVEVVRERFAEEGLPPIDVELFLQPAHRRFRVRYLEATRHAFRDFGRRYGPYPYDTLTVVDPQPGSTAGGMEYPTLFTGGVDYYSPPWTRRPEGVTVHEYGHQYWYGLVASNEFEAAWLDEGVNSYSETKVLDRAYGPELPAYEVAGLKLQRFVPVDLEEAPLIPVPGWSLDSPAVAAFRDLAPVSFPSGVGQEAADQHRRGYLEGPSLDPMERPAWEYVDGDSYRINAYRKPAAFLEMLESLHGEELWGRVMRTYHRRWRFAHPDSRDLLAVAEEVTGDDLSRLWEQVVHGAGVLDYGIEIADVAPVEGGTGSGESSERRAPTFRSEILVRRHGEVVLPLEIGVEFADGSTATETWDGEGRWTRYVYRRAAPVRTAEIYPGRTLWLDADLTDNGARAEPTGAPARRLSLTFLFWVQNVLHWFSLLA